MTGLLEKPTTNTVQMALTKQTPMTVVSAIDETTTTCDACPCCADVCDNSDCVSCKEKSNLYCLPVSSKKEESASPSGENKSLNTFTLCQVKRHNHKESAWVVANNAVYDVTSYLSRHPYGPACILSVAGGQDCTQGYKRHKYFARQKFEQFRIGTLKKCERAKRGRGITRFLRGNDAFGRSALPA